MTKPVVRIKHVNFFPGFDDDRCRSHVLMELCDEFAFEFSQGDHDVLLVGCYGQEPVTPARAVTVGYYTENLAPDLESFDYFFGCEYSDLIGHPRYCKRVFGPLMEGLFHGCADAEAAHRSKTRFCNFIYSTRVPHRERFFKAVGRYRPVSAPGKAMNNCADLSSRRSADWQADKLDYLRSFKFTIAFENSRRPGYATEKLFDALRADTIPIYWGDPEVGRVVNPDALVVVDGDWERDLFPWVRLPERRLQYQPYSRERSLPNRLAGRVNDLIHALRARLPYTRGFAEAVEQIIALDRDDDAYMRKLAAPRLSPEIRTIRREYLDAWRRILRDALARRDSGQAGTAARTAA